MIATDLHDNVVPIDSVAPHPRNPRQGDVGAISTSLERFGQLRPILVNSSTEPETIVAGNHVWRAAKALGWTEIAAVRVALDEAEADAFLLADNRMSDLGTYDDATLAEILVELAEAGKLDGTGYDSDDVNALLAKLAESAPPGEFPDADPSAIEGTFRCPSCGHEWTGSPRPGGDE